MQDPSSAYLSYKERRFFGSLDGVRCFCIFAVLWHHSPVFADGAGWSMQLLTRGFTGVDLFFVLSGFLITTLLLREEERNGSFSLRGFYWRRILRIVPVYFLVVSLSALYFVVIQQNWTLAPLIPYYYLFFSNMLVGDIPLLAPTWSLSVEEQYYLIWPALLLLLPMRASVRLWLAGGLILLCALSASGQLSFLGLQPVETTHAVWKISANSFTGMLLGSFFAVMLQTKAGFLLLYRLFGHALSPLLFLALLLAYLQFGPLELSGWANLGLHCVMVCFLISVVLREDHVLSGLLAWRPIARVGEVSYGVYLYHLFALDPALRLDAAFGLGAWSATLLMVVFSLIIAEVSFRTYERFFLSFKNKPSGKASKQSG